MNVLVFDPYSSDAHLLPAKAAKVAKVAEIRHFSDAKEQEASAKAARASACGLAALAAGSETLAPGNPQKTSTLAVLAGLAISGHATVNPGATITVPCSRCGTMSRPFAEVINGDLWLCDGCWPACPDDAAHDAIERQGIAAEGDASAPVLIAMPVSWADASLIPTPGARCRNCASSSWWCERDTPRGWRCSTCHPGDHLPAAAVRVVRT